MRSALLNGLESYSYYLTLRGVCYYIVVRLVIVTYWEPRTEPRREHVCSSSHSVILCQLLLIR